MPARAELTRWHLPKPFAPQDVLTLIQDCIALGKERELAAAYLAASHTTAPLALAATGALVARFWMVDGRAGWMQASMYAAIARPEWRFASVIV